jgi:ubiquitin-protein ligase
MAVAPFNPRQSRLELERQRLAAVNKDSDHVKVEPVDVLPGRAPERYRVTFLCRGIAGIDSSRDPIYATKHEVVVYCHNDFPADAPWLHWETPIWHPNIQHAEPKGVCINKAEWLGGMGLDDLCHQMFEMVQYKNYHADVSPPYPLDSEAAAWVRDYAEPRGIVNKRRGIFVDNQLFYKPDATDRPRIRVMSSQPSVSQGTRIKIHRAGGETSRGSDTRAVFTAGAGPLRCGACGAELPSGSQYCEKCGARLETGTRRLKFKN